MDDDRIEFEIDTYQMLLHLLALLHDLGVLDESNYPDFRLRDNFAIRWADKKMLQ